MWPFSFCVAELLSGDGLGRHLIDARRQPRFVARGGVLVQYALLDGFIEERHGGGENGLRLCLIARIDGGAQGFDLRAQAAAVAAIDFVAPLVLSHAFFG
jgi:hypothetical protein